MSTSKLKILFILALFLYPFLGFTQWYQLEVEEIDKITFRDVYCISENTVFIIGDNTILKTEDGGITWSIKNIPDCRLPGQCRFSFFFLNNKIGYISTDGFILKTEDGGETWFNIEPYDNFVYNTIFFTDENNGFTSGCPPILLQTVDGGENWHKAFGEGYGLSGIDVINSIFFSSKNIGYVLGFSVGASGKYGEIRKTINGGASWFSLYGLYGLNIPEFWGMRNFYSVYFLDDFNGWVGGVCDGLPADCQGGLFKTTDGGETWDTIKTAFNFVTDIFFADSNTGFITSATGFYDDGRNIHKTTDGGTTWEQQTFLEDENVLSIHCANPDVCYAVGTNSLILKTTTGGANIVSEIKKDADFNAYPNPFDNSTTISFGINESANVNVYIINVYGQLVHQLHNKYIKAGSYELILDGSALQPGVYFCVMEADKIKKVISLVKF